MALEEGLELEEVVVVCRMEGGLEEIASFREGGGDRARIVGFILLMDGGNHYSDRPD